MNQREQNFKEGQTEEMSAAEIINKLLQQIGQLNLQMAALQAQNDRLQGELSAIRKKE